MGNLFRRLSIVGLLLVGMVCNSFGEELRSAGYLVSRYTIDRRFDPDEQPGKLKIAPTTRMLVYEASGKLRLAMHFYPDFDDSNQANVTYVEKLGSGVDTGFFILSAPVKFADSYSTLLKAGKIKRIDGTYDKSQPQGNSTIRYATTKFRLLLESE
ncbi:hypothetical protein [Thalassoroseus pseudoceratinae]|uniref:hypothetical protein n=1 Tax=Thalassoroseus pseudoceratinae TaxID=2713176 RepID=UPI00141EA6E0|nr:hypothetical protein [Thalassoroseus pseudoceratinae]